MPILLIQLLLHALSPANGWAAEVSADLTPEPALAHLHQPIFQESFEALLEEERRAQAEALQQQLSTLDNLYDDNTADEGSLSPLIPEPLNFDLVRPLGAKRGELEVNVLGNYPLSRRRFDLEWAPEIEYAFRDGQAVELELPFSNGRLDAIKLGYQLTLPRHQTTARYAHGLQVIGRNVFKHADLEPESAAEATYIYGYAWSNRLSTMTITGLRANFNRHGNTRIELLANPSLFYHVSKRVTVGLENNLQFQDHRNYHLNILPQVFVEFGAHTSMQMGMGVTKGAHGKIHPLFALRLIRTLN